MNNPDEREWYPALSEKSGFLPRIKRAEQYGIKILPFIPRGLPVYQSHGISHSQAIIRNINQILKIPLLHLSELEVFHLYLAAWFHDIGYLHPLSIYNRSRHPELSVEMIRRDPVVQEVAGGEDLLVLETITRFHDSRTDLSTIQEVTPRVRISLLAALFRLADAVDIGTDRCPPEVFILIEDGLDEHSRRHWQAHQNIQEVVIAYPIINIMVHDLENPFFRRRIIPHLEDDCRNSGQILKKYEIDPFTLRYLLKDPD